jgi:hypothetical protein
MPLYRASREERSIFWEILASAILSKEVYIYMCYIPNSVRDRAISLYSALYTVQTNNTHVLTRVAKCIEVDGEILENVLH